MSTLVSLVSSEVHFIHEEAEECQSLLYTVLFTVIAVTVIRNIGILLLPLLLMLLSYILSYQHLVSPAISIMLNLCYKLMQYPKVHWV